MTAGRLPIAGYQASLFMALVFAIITASLYEPVMVWVILLTGCSLLVRIALYLGWYHSAPSQRTINLLAILSALALAWFSPRLGLLLSMVNLLVMACALKLMTLSRRRDFLQLFACGLFLLGCGYIFSQSIGSAFFYSALLVFLLFALISAYAPSLSKRKRLKTLTVMFIQATPIAALLFLILPKLPPLWKMPTAQSSTTGLADKVTPGDIAKLSQSDELVFNATFINDLPRIQERYWRAITLENFDGASWQISPLRKQAREQYQQMGHEFAPRLQGPAYHYQVIAEPTGQSWLYGIDVAVASDASSRAYIWQGADYQLIAAQPLMSKRVYSLSSYPQTALNQTLPSLDQRINLQVPTSGNERTQAWVAQLRKTYSEDAAFINAILSFFANNTFRYTLSPPTMPVDPVDTFLFEAQKGFCVHYASAMAYSLRLAGIPARIVTGYHGGELLTQNVLSVRQYDAHAWVEALLGERGWVRFDPTSVVAPARINFGLREALEEAGETASQSGFDRLNQWEAYNQVRQLLANMDYLWSRWVLGYDASKQKNLLELILGQVTPTKISLFLLAVLAVISGLLALYFIPRWNRHTLARHQQIHARAIGLIEAYTHEARHHTSSRAYYQRVAPSLPGPVAALFAELIQQFEKIEYLPNADQNNDNQLKQLGRTLRLLKQSIKKHPRRQKKPVDRVHSGEV